MGRSSLTSTPARPSSVDGGHPGRSHRTLRVYAVGATAFTFLLIAVGGLVRATGSGLGCPGWPRCFGRWVPPLEEHAVIEYSHRLTAALVFLFLAGLVVVTALRYRGVTRVVRPVGAAVALYVAQAVLGGIVVRLDLRPALVTAHLGTAMLFAATLVAATVAAYTIDARPSGPSGPLPRLARATAGATLVLILVGAAVRGEGAGLAFRDWPFMDGTVFPSLSSVGPTLMFFHRVLAVAVGLLVLWLAVRVRRDRTAPAAIRTLAAAAALLFLAQVVAGAFSVWTALAPAAVVAHVTLSSLVWGSLVATAAAARAGEWRPSAAPVQGVAG